MAESTVVSSNLKRSTDEHRSIAFGVITVFFAIITGWAIRDGQDITTVSLWGAATVYTLGNTLPVVQRRIPRFDRVAAVPLGIVGVITYVIGAPTDLPIFFIILGVGSTIDLLWDPTGTVYADDSD